MPVYYRVTEQYDTHAPIRHCICCTINTDVQSENDMVLHLPV